MTPTVTQSGETVTIQIGDASAVLSPSQASEYADAVRMAAAKARDATWQRQKDDARAGQVARFRAIHPNAVPVRKSAPLDAKDGIGVYRRTNRGPVAEVLWNTGQWVTARIDVIPAWPKPVPLPHLADSCSRSTTVRATRLMNTGRCVDLELTHELLAQRPIGFGASTATLSQFKH